MDLAFPPGAAPSPAGPLVRFLPPLEEGVAERALQDRVRPGALVLDPFGGSPRLVVELARSGRAVLVAAANPVTRFILERRARPLPAAALQAALATLASAPKNGSRLEPFLLELYSTVCSNCGRTVSCEYFVWDREAGRPVRRAYTCPFCNHVAEEATTAEDVERAEEFDRHGLARARALEQVAPAADPDRASAEAALSVYPGRAVYALIAVLNKLEQIELEPEVRLAAEGLLLSACDAANALWGYPEGRTRPRQLTASPQFREINVWRALERAIEEWIWQDPGVLVRPWQRESLPGPGEVAVFSGPVRDLLGELRGLPLDAVVTVLPRPNQAHWTLSALWTAWLWGRGAAGPIRAALRRRRYDWAWHASALRASLVGLASAIPAGAPIFGFVPEAEPGFLAAVLAGLDAGGFRLTGRALREEDGQALFTWDVSPRPSTSLAGARGASPAHGRRAQDAELGLWKQRLADAAQETLEAWAQPARYAVLHAASWTELAARRWLGPLWQESEDLPISRVADEFVVALNDRRRFVRLDSRAELETGVFWLAEAAPDTAPLMDRVELAVLRMLRREGVVQQRDVEEALCQEYPGLLSPDRGLVRSCLFSYAVEDEQAGGGWKLRDEDLAVSRREDREGLIQLVSELGGRLGFRTAGPDPLLWLDEQGREAYRFHILETAAFGELLNAPASQRSVAVIPGGRGVLVAEKARRDPRLEAWLREGSRVVKYRHIRRLAEEATLKRENLAERLALDPPGREDPQLPLL